MDPKILLARISLAFNAIALILTLSSMIYTFLAIGFTLVGLKTGYSVAPENAEINKNWYVQISLYLFALLNLLALVYEIVVNAMLKRLGFGHFPPVRGVFYIFLGFSVMGLSADLGIASGILLILAGIATCVVQLILGTGWNAGPQALDFTRVTT
jgi:hypothetical protein